MVGGNQLDRISGWRSEDYGIFGRKHLQEFSHVFRINERPDAIMDEDVGNRIGQTLESVKDRSLTGFAAGDEFNFAKFLECRR